MSATNNPPSSSSVSTNNKTAAAIYDSSAALKPKQGDNFYEQAKHYIRYIASVVSGPKILLVDDEVSRCLNVTFTHSELLSFEVFVVDQIQRADRFPMKFFHCVTFVRPTQENFQAVCSELELGNYKDYYLFFTNMFGIDQMQFLVRSDTFGKVRHCEEVFLDMFPVTDEACTVPLVTFSSSFAVMSASSSSSLPLKNPMTIQQWDNNDFVRAIDGLIAMALSTGRRPEIRYRASSRVCSRLASEFGARARNLHHRFFDLPSKDSVILILDRFDDPVTPLITPWTYQAICHEILGIENGIVETNQIVKRKKPPPTPEELAAAAATSTSTTTKPNAAAAVSVPASSSSSSIGGKAPPNKEEFITEVIKEQHVLSVDTDAFFRSNRDLHWPELCVATRDLVEAFLEINKVDLRAKSLAEIGAIGEKVPEMKQQNLTATRHSTIVSEIGRKVKERQLSTISVLEQDIVCGSIPTFQSFTDYAKRFLDVIGNKQQYADEDALRLAILFELRYESRRDAAVSGSIRQLLRTRGIDGRIVDAVLFLCGNNKNHQRPIELFPAEVQQTNVKTEQKAKQFFQSFARVLKEFNGDESVSKVRTRHIPMMQHVLEACAKGSLSTESFPYYRSSQNNNNNNNSNTKNNNNKDAVDSDVDDNNHNNVNSSAPGFGAFSQQQPKQILVFMVGGLTYAEALIAKRINDATKNASYSRKFASSSSAAASTTTASKKKKTNNNNDSSGSDNDDSDEEEDFSDKVPDSLIGCKVFVGSTSMLTSKTFLRGLPPPSQ